jgi:hypothetical protein
MPKTAPVYILAIMGRLKTEKPNQNPIAKKIIKNMFRTVRVNHLGITEL